MTATIQDRIVTLMPRLIGYSNFVHSPEMEREDATQEMALALLERAGEDPELAVQSSYYLTQYALWQARKVATRQRAQAVHIADPLEADEEPVFFQITGEAHPEDPEVAAERAEMVDELLDVVATLTPENQTVVRMIYLGYSESEIAEKLHISRPAVTQRKATIARTIQARHRI